MEPGIYRPERPGIELIDAVPPLAVLPHQLRAMKPAQVPGDGGTRHRKCSSDFSGVAATRPQQIENIEFNAGAAGVKNIQAKLNPLPGEENSTNNQLTRVLSVDETKRRILYVEGEPRWEYKFLRRNIQCAN